MRLTSTGRATAVVVLASALALSGCAKKSDTSSGGGGSTGTSSASGGGGAKKKIAFVPKLQGIPYFEAMNAGGKQAATELGLQWLYQGPTQADAAAQAQIVRSFIQQKVDTLIVAPNDPDSMAPVLQQAKAAGIKVLTSDTDAPSSVRSAFVSQASTEGIGTALVDELAKAMGDKGKYAIVSCGETAQNLNSWIAVQKKVTAEKHKDLKIVSVVFAGEDQNKATQMATDLMNAHPDLTGLVGECTSSAPGVAQAVKDANKIGKVFTVGLGTPMSMAPYLKEGSSSASILWDVQNLGYLTAWAGLQAAQDKPLEASNKVNAKMTSVAYDDASKVLLLGPPLVITKDNVGDFSY